jgi:hypothetical protein
MPPWKVGEAPLGARADGPPHAVIAKSLAKYARERTRNGRELVDFMLQVMRGEPLPVRATRARRARRCSVPTEAQLFRGAATTGGARLFDEIEGLGGDKERADALIAVLNVGFERGGVVTRLEKRGERFEEQRYEVYAPRALAGIAALKDVLADRALPVFMACKRYGCGGPDREATPGGGPPPRCGACGRVGPMAETLRPPVPFNPGTGARTDRNTVGLRAPWRPGQSGNPRGGAVSLFSLAARIRRASGDGQELVDFFFSVFRGQAIPVPGRGCP